MITNKDLSIDSENGKIILNGDKYDLGTQGEIDTAVKGVYSVMGQNGAKNLIPYPYASNSYSQRNIDFTCLSDGTINANGTNDGTGNSTYSFVSFTLSKGSYVINGCPAQTGVNYRWGVVRVSDSTTLAADYGSGANFTINADTEVRVFAQVVSGKTVNNIIFKPMLRLASDTDNTYQPYAKTNKELTDAIYGIRPSAGNIAGEVLTLSGTQDNALVFNETGNDDYKGMIVNDKDGNERYRLYFTGGHIKFLSKAADGTTIVDTTLA